MISMSQESPIESSFTAIDEKEDGKRLERQAWVRGEFLRKGSLKRQLIEGESGERTLVLSSISLLPPEITTPTKDKRLRVVLFSPGMFQMDEVPDSHYAANYGNHPLEINLDSAMLTGDVDVVMVLKAEGLNDICYQDDSGNGIGQKKVSEAAVGVFAKEIDLLLKSRGMKFSDLEIRVLGHSEGATQAASIAARIIERGIGKVKDLTAIMPAGLSGITLDQVRSLKDFLASSVVRRLKSLSYPNSRGQSSGNEYKISASEISKFDRRFAIGGVETYSDVEADKRNIGRWFLRLAGGDRRLEKILPQWAEFAAKWGIAENVPASRLVEADRQNQDYDAVVKAGVPLFVVAGSKDVLFPAGEIRQRISALSHIQGGKVAALFVDGDHVSSHTHPSGVAHALELLRRKVNF